MKNLTDTAVHILSSAPGLSVREGQQQMMRLVADLFAGELPGRKAVAIEAGTGTGKSLAYLLPVMLSGKRAVVATGTKNLQCQLILKDAPFATQLVEAVTGRKPTVAVLYGRQNYLCPALLHQRHAQLQAWLAGILSLPPDQLRQVDPARVSEACWVEMLADWLGTGGSGVQDDLPSWPYLPASESDRQRWWSNVSADSDDAECSECDRAAECVFQRARSAAAKAQVVIANHHLVMADHTIRARVGVSVFSDRENPPPEVLVLDEAHDFPDAVRSALGMSFTLSRVRRLAADVVRFLNRAHGWAGERGFDREATYIREKRESAEYFVTQNFPALESQIGDLFQWAQEKLDGRDRVLLRPGDTPPGAEAALEAMENFFSIAGGLLSYAFRAVEMLESAVADRELKKQLDVLERRAGRLTERMIELKEAFRRAVLLESHYRKLGEEGDACWLEPGRFCAAPVDVSQTLQEIWAHYRYVVMTSATLFPFPQSDGFPWFRKNSVSWKTNQCWVWCPVRSIIRVRCRPLH